jgi:hypothetical protein
MAAVLHLKHDDQLRLLSQLVAAFFRCEDLGLGHPTTDPSGSSGGSIP